MRRKIVIVALCMVALLVVPGVGQGVNHHEPATLNRIIIDQDGRLLVPVLEEYGRPGVLVATEFHSISLGLSLQMPMLEMKDEEIFVLTENQEGQLYIRLLDDGEAYQASAGRVLGIETTISVYPDIRVLDNTPEGRANGRLVCIPLINYPVNTNGYVMVLLPNPDGPGRIIPLIEMPRGHLTAQQHTDNPNVNDNLWGIDFDMLMPVDYSIINFK